MGAWDGDSRERTARLFRFQEGSLAQGEAAPGNLHRVQRQPSTAPLPAGRRRLPRAAGPAFPSRDQRGGRQLAPCGANRSSATNADWLRRTIELFRAHPDWNLMVRAHPDEAWVGERVVVRMGEVARSLAGGLPNVLVIGGDEDVSSYALMRGLAGGLVWISSIGADMVGARDRGARRGPAQVPRARPGGRAPNGLRLLRLGRVAGREPGARHPRAAGPGPAVPRRRLLAVLVRRFQPLLSGERPLPRGARLPARRGTSSIASSPATFPPRLRRGARRARWRESEMAPVGSSSLVTARQWGPGAVGSAEGSAWARSARSDRSCSRWPRSTSLLSWATLSRFDGWTPCRWGSGTPCCWSSSYLAVLRLGLINGLGRELPFALGRGDRARGRAHRRDLVGLEHGRAAPSRPRLRGGLGIPLAARARPGAWPFPRWRW